MASETGFLPIDTELEHLRVGAGWIEIEIQSEPFVIYRNRKYNPVIHIKEVLSGLSYVLFISAASLGEALEDFRSEHGVLTGKVISIRKGSADRFAPYEIEER